MTTREVVDIDSCDDDDDDDENNKGGYHHHDNYYNNENDDDDMRALHTFGTPIGGGDDGDDNHDGSMSSSSSSSYHHGYHHPHESNKLNNSSNNNDNDDHYYSSTSHDEDDENDRHHVVMTKTTDRRNYHHHNNDTVLLFENSSNDDSNDDDNNACHFTDDGWNTVRQRLDDQMEQTRLATLPPTPHQLQMAEELAKNSANKKQKDYINIKIKKPTLKKQSSKNNARRGRQQDGDGGKGNSSSRKLGWSSGSDDDGILLNSPKVVIGGGGDGSLSSSSNKGGMRRKKLTLAKFRSTRSGMSSVSGVSTLGSGDERYPTEDDNQTRNSLSASGTFINSLAQEFKEKTKIGGGSSSAGGQGYRHDSQQQQQQWSLSGPPSNTVSVRCGRDSSSTSSSSFENPTTSKTAAAVMTIPPRHGHTVHSNMFRPLLLIQSNRRAHKGSIYVMKFSPHGGHFLATGGEDTRVCIWQVAPDVKPTTTSTMDNHDSEGNPTKGMRMDGGGSPERFVAGAREQEEAAEHAISQYRTTADSLIDDNNTKQTPHFDKDILTHEGGSMPLGTDIHLLSKEPYVVFQGHHTAEIVDLAWSQQPPPFVRSSKKKKQKRRHEPFLLTASLDKMILLWHMSRPLAPLHKFAHADMVTCVDFHPTDDSLFVSGGFDSKLRLWSIADGRVKSYAQCPDIITSAKFTPDSNMIVAGLMKGQVFFYLSNSMTYYTQIDSKNRRGKNSEGCKVTGIEFFTSNTTSTSTTTPTNSIQEQQQQRQSPSSSPTATNKKRKDYMLVTTNDSRLRIFDIDDAFRQIQKCKGLKNTQMQIKSHFCQSGQFIICGSETGSVYIWENEHEHEQQQRLNQNAGTTSKDNNNDSSGGGGGTPTFMSKLKVKKGGGATTVGNILSSTSTAYASFDGCPRRRAVAVSQQQLLSGSGSSIPNVIGGGSIISGGGESTITGNGVATVIQQGAVTDAIFVPSESVLDSITKSELFCSTLQTCEQVIHRLPNEDFSSSMMVAGDNEGSLRIFLRRSCFDAIIRASGPAGSPHNR